jgi:hypothetical protein
MKRKWLFNLVGVVLTIALAFGFAACGDAYDDDDGDGDSSSDRAPATDAQLYIYESGANYDSSERYAGNAKVKIRVHDQTAIDERGYPAPVYIDAGTIADGKLTITLPATVDGKYLENDSDILEGLTVNPTTVKLTAVDIYAYTNKDELIGPIYYEKETAGANSSTIRDTLSLMYFDSPATIEGSVDGGYREENYNIEGKKGWNKVHERTTVTADYDYSISLSSSGLPTDGKWLIRVYNNDYSGAYSIRSADSDLGYVFD